MSGTLIVLFFTATVSGIIAAVIGWYWPYIDGKPSHEANPYKFGYFVGFLYIFFGFFWLELFLLDLQFSLIGHDFSQNILLSLIFSIGAIITGLGVSWRVKIILISTPCASLVLPFFYIQGLDDGLHKASILEITLLLFIFLLNGYYFYYNFLVLKLMREPMG